MSHGWPGTSPELTLQEEIVILATIVRGLAQLLVERIPEDTVESLLRDMTDRGAFDRLSEKLRAHVEPTYRLALQYAHPNLS